MYRNYDEQHYQKTFEKDKKFVEKTMDIIDDSIDEDDDKLLFNMICVLQRVINWKYEDRKWFDEKYNRTIKFSFHGFKGNPKLTFDIHGIRIFTPEEDLFEQIYNEMKNEIKDLSEDEKIEKITNGIITKIDKPFLYESYKKIVEILLPQIKD